MSRVPDDLRDEALAVFAYAFPHRKTQDFLVELALSGFRDVTVFAAPWRALPHSDRETYFRTSLTTAEPRDTRQVCEALGFELHEIDHESTGAIAAQVQRRGIRLGIVAGARILKHDVIELFQEGIVNFHPGKIPETSGLDLFYHTIRSRVPIGVTAHYIDHRVDAGDLLFFLETPLTPDATPEIVQANNYQTQIRALRQFIALRDGGELTPTPAVRPVKNDPMPPDEKRACLIAFPEWLAAQYRAQQGRVLLKACEAGDAEQVRRGLDRLPDLIEFRAPEGWTPLIVACFHQHTDVAALLLERGADPNTPGCNGTTPLMYAKTAVVEGRTDSTALFDILIEAGADWRRHDAYGHDIFHYLDDEYSQRFFRLIEARGGEAE